MASFDLPKEPRWAAGVVLGRALLGLDYLGPNIPIPREPSLGPTTPLSREPRWVAGIVLGRALLGLDYLGPSIPLPREPSLIW